ncbi:YXWGXW repeat-containing protein [Jeongeupia chitinilytica]|uniref:YXWGXW repeat-containing protein n=1 Tax=Jeongeupia chitinilytica TaxID=1041641 RepID=A0ABQ3H1Q6_9NEIS|nr:YXWGXW repeat-containing protein [Jeongeupia chitinilytica]GHD63187.1 hypothetical protein GCM10007350_20130 [Jeongeupia chitinilytica]
MFRRTCKVLLIAAALSLAPQALARTDIDVYIGISPPVRIEQAPPVRYGYVWRPGYWVATEPRARYRWKRGYWARDPYYRPHGSRHHHKERHHHHHRHH